MKKILLLGGSAQQIVAIETAKNLGYYTILCDYLKDNPGQYVADKFYLVSTTDKEAVLKVARCEVIDGVLAYASDPAAPTAAYVAEQLNLPGNPYESVKILCNKDRFRTFLKEHDFCTPVARGYLNIERALRDIEDGLFQLPVIVKPVDASGSKGVERIDRKHDAEDKLNYAMSFSRDKRIIVEEFVEKLGYQVAGDGLSVHGELVFRCFANDHFDSKCVNPFVPVSASFPCQMPKEIQDKMHNEIQRLLSLLHMETCTYNFDIRIDQAYNVYLMEIAPRNGGNYIPQIIKYMTNVDLVEYAIQAALGEEIVLSEVASMKGYWAYYALHSLQSGILDEIIIDADVKQNYLIESHILKRSGDKIEAFTGANTTLGILLMKFESMEQMLEMINNAEQWINIKLI